MTPLKVLILSLALLGCTAYGCVANIAMQPGAVSVYVQPQSNVWTTGTPEATPTPETWLPTPTCTPTLVPYVVKFDNVRLREGDSTTTGIAGKLNKGDRVYINFCNQEDVAEDWFRVQVPEGFIYAPLIEPSHE